MPDTESIFESPNGSLVVDAMHVGRPRSFPAATDSVPAAAPFVGRTGELRALRDTFDAVAGAGRGVLLSGDPGIGKTRLASELATALAQDGVEVHWGRCWEVPGAPAFWPWIQVVRSCVAAHPPATIVASLGEALGDLAALAPELRSWCAEPVRPQPSNPHEARFLVFDAVARLLRTAARERHLLLCLDDLHHADVASLLLLQFLTTELHTLPIGILGTYRDLALDRETPLWQTLAELGREPLVGQIVLRGLTASETTALVEHGVGRRAPLALARDVYDRTRGNPLFVREIVQGFARDGGDPIGALRSAISHVPATIREAIEHRLARLSPGCRGLLEVAAVIGRDFDVDLLAASVPIDWAATSRAIDEAVQAGLVLAAPGRFGRFRFAHVLDRDVLYGGLPSAHRTMLHRRIGEALERWTSADGATQVAALARHFFEAARDGTAAKAVAYALRAATAAVDAAAFEDAVTHYQRAVDVLEGGGDPVAIAELLLGLGDAQRRAGAADESRAAFTRAAAIARATARPEILARAALGIGEPWVVLLEDDDLLIDLLEEALAMLDERDDPLRARVLAGLAWADSKSPRAVRDERSRRAVAMAQRVGDHDAHLFAVTARLYAIFSARDMPETIASARALVAVSEASGHEDQAALAHALLSRVLLEVADVDAGWRHLDAGTAAAGRGRLLRSRWRIGTARTMRALLEGRYADAEALMLETHDLGRRSHEPIAEPNFYAQLFLLRLEQGRIAELLPAFADVVARCDTPTWRCAWAWAVATTGDHDTACAILDHPALRDPASFTEGPYEVGTLAMYAGAVGEIEDAARAAVLRDQLTPYRDRIVVIGAPCVSFGAVARVLGTLETVLGRWTTAEACFEDALRTNARLGSPPQVALTQLDYAHMLLARDRARDARRAEALIEAATRTAERLGMGDLLRRLGALQRASVGVHTGNVFRRDGGVWTMRFGGVVAHHRDLKGLQYIALLLRHQGLDVHAAVLAALTDAGGTEVPARLGDCGPLLDARARDEVRDRLRELDEEVRIAERSNDLGRVAALRREGEFLDQELARAFDRRGRPRVASSQSERARISVRNDITRALRSIAACHPALANHLDGTLKTGTFCSYRPPAALVWDI